MCLFSSKLHDFLQPKRHLLAESDDRYVEPFIKPLLDRPDSTYRYSQLSITTYSSYWSEFQRIQANNDLLPSRPVLSADDPGRRQLDPSVLIVGNLARNPRRTPAGLSIPFQNLFMFNYAQQALSNRLLFNSGLFRTLLWLPETFKSSFIAKLPWTRTTSCLNLDMAFSVNEAVSVRSLETVHQSHRPAQERRMRFAEFDRLNAEKIQAKMLEAGMHPPSDRETVSLRPLDSDKQERISMRSPFEPTAETFAQLYEQIEAASARIRATYPWIRYRFRVFSQEEVGALQFPQSIPIAEAHKAKFYGSERQLERMTNLLDLGLVVLNSEVNFKELEDKHPSSSELEIARGRTLALGEEYNELKERVPYNARVLLQLLIEDQVAFFISPSLLTLYERSYDPLKSEPSDYWPWTKSLTLFDLVPKSRDLSVPGLADNTEGTRFALAILKVLLNRNTLPFPQALDRVAINAAKDLIPKVPAITDPRRGGRLNPNDLRARMVTEEMVEGLVKAFFEWPFRPVAWQKAIEEEDDPEEDAEEGVDVPIS